jgi:hypothetical protein
LGKATVESFANYVARLSPVKMMQRSRLSLIFLYKKRLVILLAYTQCFNNSSIAGRSVSQHCKRLMSSSADNALSRRDAMAKHHWVVINIKQLFSYLKIKGKGCMIAEDKSP